jgi:cell division protein FtsN
MKTTVAILVAVVVIFAGTLYTIILLTRHA